MHSETQVKYFFWVGTTVMIIFGVAVIGFIGFYRKRLFRIKKEETEFLLKSSLELESKERRRLAADLHDSVCGDLSAIRNYLAILELQQDSINVTGKALIQEIKENINVVLQNTKAIISNMMPPLIETSGFIPALEDHICRLNKISEIAFELTYNERNLSLSDKVSYELYRIFQELFSNMIKYGNVNKVTISFVQDNAKIIIAIVDDGTPFSFKTMVHESSGIGIKNIYARLNVIRGHISQFPMENGNHLVITLN